MKLLAEKPVMQTTERIPYPFQELVLKKIVPQDKIALFVEMRLGKTLMTINWLKRKKIGKTLIVCPLSVVPVWEKELKLEGVEFITCATSNKELQQVINLWHGVVITNYEALPRTELADLEWECVILDESHRIRRKQAKLSKVCAESFQHVKYKALLTGTPAPESLLDYFQQFKFLIGHFLGIEDYHQFKAQYFYTSYGSNKPEIKITMVPIVREFIKKHSMILRRSNPLVMANLKNTKIYEQKYVELSDDAKKAYEEFEKTWFMKARNNNDRDVMANWVIVAQNYLHQMSGGFIKGTEEYFSDHKLKEISELLETDLKGEKIVIFSRFRKELDKIQEYFKDLRIKQINGSIEHRQRLEYIDELGNGNLDLLLCQIKTASVGINISCSSTAIYYSNTWENVDRLQSEDRLVGPKTSEDTSLLYIDILTKGTIDEDLYEALQAKRERTDLDFLQRVYDSFKSRMAG